MNAQVMGTPIPTRFRGDEEQFLREAKDATGVSTLELIRRGVRLMKRQQEIVRSYGFILELSEPHPKR